MSNIIFHDTETTGLPNWKIPSDDESQPHMVQLGAIVADSETRKVIDRLDVIIKPDEWEISQEMTDIHGISQEQAMAEGIPERDAVNMFLKLWGIELVNPALRVAHNRTFDQRIIRIALKRYEYGQEILDKWAGKEDYFCTMLKSKPIMEMLPKNRYGFKNPKLEEAYEFFTGKKLENAHTAMADSEACMEIYWGLEDHVKKEAK